MLFFQPLSETNQMQQHYGGGAPLSSQFGITQYIQQQAMTPPLNYTQESTHFSNNGGGLLPSVIQSTFDNMGGNTQ
jgi:hypothetical protein